MYASVAGAARRLFLLLEMYSEQNKEGIPATYQVINFIGWKPDPAQKQAAARGSGQVSMKNIAEISKLTDQLNAIKREGKTDPETVARLEKISKELEALNEMYSRPKPDDTS